jgi:hypothetical protein
MAGGRDGLKPMPIRDQYAALTDSALEALSSKGLLRRAAADLAAGKARLKQETERGLAIEVDGETVELGPGGPLQVQCSCRAATMCRHRLSAFLLLREAPAAAEQASSAPVSWPDILAAFSEEQLERWGGSASFRQGREMAAVAAKPSVTEGGASLRISILDNLPEIVIRSTGGLDAILSTVPVRKRKAAHMAAVLLARRYFGLAEAELRASLAEQAKAIEPAFLDQVRAALEQGFLTGFAMAPRSLQNRLLSLAVSSRAQAAPRLAGLLREIAAGLEKRRNRNPEHDARAHIMRLATAYALCTAIAARPDDAARLAGLYRQIYEPVGDLRLHAVGAELWETASGARGVTGYFYDAERSRWHTATLSRPDANDAFFDPVRAFRQESVWNSTLERLANGIVSLKGARVSDRGRLSLGQETKATQTLWLPNAEEVASWHWAFDDWQRLAKVLEDGLASGLAGAAPAVPVILRPGRLGAAQFDDISQSLVWPVGDRNGRWIGLTLPHEGMRSLRLDRLERLLSKARPWAILATASLAAETIEVTPFGLWTDEQVLLDFWTCAEPVPERGVIHRLIGRFRQAKEALSDRSFVRLAPLSDQTRRLMTQAVDEFVRGAEMSSAMTSEQWGARLAQLSSRFRAAALEPIAIQLEAAAAAAEKERAESCLRAVFAIHSLQTQRARLTYLLEAT